MLRYENVYCGYVKVQVSLSRSGLLLEEHIKPKFQVHMWSLGYTFATVGIKLLQAKMPELRFRV